MIKETIEKLENIIDEAIYELGNNELGENIEKVICMLKQPIPLADFLGWDEYQKYEYNDKIFKIINNRLYSKDIDGFAFKEDLLVISQFNELRNASKIETKKYYLKFKGEYISLLRFAFKINYLYLNYNHISNEYFLNTKEQKESYQTKFTEEEIKNIKLPDNITLDMFDMIEVNNV